MKSVTEIIAELKAKNPGIFSTKGNIKKKVDFKINTQERIVSFDESYTLFNGQVHVNSFAEYQWGEDYILKRIKNERSKS